MTEWSEFLSASNLGATGLLAITVLLVLFGRLQPRSNVTLWQQAYYKAQAANELKDAQILEMMQANAVALRALDALPKPSQAEGGERHESDRKREEVLP